jgi:hypothetical protein
VSSLGFVAEPAIVAVDLDQLVGLPAAPRSRRATLSAQVRTFAVGVHGSV